MALTAANPRLLNVFGEKTEIAAGSVDGSGASTVVTVPQLSKVHGKVC